MAAVRSREVRVVEVDTPFPSPFASSLQFGYVAAFMYEGDAPLGERRAQALSLDRRVLAELLGREELRDLVDQAALAELELELQLLAPGRKVRGADELHDALRLVGDLSVDEACARAVDPAAVPGLLAELEGTRRAVRLRVAGVERWVAIEDVARFRDGLGAAPPVGVPADFLRPVADPVGDLVARYARTHGPFTPSEPARRLGLGVAVVRETLARLAAAGRVAEGEFRPGGSGSEWLDAEVLRRLRRRSLAALRHEVEAAPQPALARFLSAWQGIGPAGPRFVDLDATYRVVEQLAGAAVPASALERQVLAARLPGYQPVLLDQLCASGEVVWAGAGALGSDDGWVALYPAAEAAGRRRRAASARRRAPAAGACCQSGRARRPAAWPPPPRACSTGTAWSPAARSPPSASPAASPAPTPCSRRWRRAAAAGAATSWTASAAPSSPRRAPWTACVAWSSRRATRRRWCSPPPTRPTPTAPRSPGRTVPARATAAPATVPAARPARWSPWSTASSPSTSRRVAAACSPSPTTATGSAAPPTPSPWPCTTARSAGWRSRRPTTRRSSTAPWPRP